MGKYGIAVEGTDVFISLKTLDLKPGDEVITAANTAIPTISAIIMQVENQDWCIETII